MRTRIFLSLLGAAVLVSGTLAHAAGVGLPGDRGPMGGGPPQPGAPTPAGPPPNRPPPPPPSPAAAPPIELALKAAQAIAAACKQYPYGLAIVDADGVAKLIYVPDGAEAWHGYSAVRKAYTAITFKTDTSQMRKNASTDPTIAEKFKSDPNLQFQSGGVLLKAGDKIIGAIGVSGAEPGGHDEECGMVGRDAIKDSLK